MWLGSGAGVKLELGLHFVMSVTGVRTPSPTLPVHTITQVAKPPFTPKQGGNGLALTWNQNRKTQQKEIKVF